MLFREIIHLLRESYESHMHTMDKMQFFYVKTGVHKVATVFYIIWILHFDKYQREMWKPELQLKTFNLHYFYPLWLGDCTTTTVSYNTNQSNFIFLP
jgi:hypothetical protein